MYVMTMIFFSINKYKFHEKPVRKTQVMVFTDDDRYFLMMKNGKNNKNLI